MYTPKSVKGETNIALDLKLKRTYLLHFCICLVMLGVIWVIQIVHYPSFRFAKLGPFRDFTSFHVKAISSIVIPLMTIELLSGSFLAYKSPRPLILLNFTLILLFKTIYWDTNSWNIGRFIYISVNLCISSLVNLVYFRSWLLQSLRY